MHTPTPCRHGLHLLIAVTGATAHLAALAAPPAAPQVAFMEQAQTQASGAQIRSFGVPTTDSTGKVLYWDVTVDLSIGANGKPAGTATVSSVKQVVLRSNRLVAGNYTDSFGGTCTVNTATLPGGRQEASIACVKPGGYSWYATVDNGEIAGHPFELQLIAADIGGITGYQSYVWGVNGTTVYSCMATNGILSARQVGTQIVTTYYGSNNISDCGLTLTQVP